MPISLGTQLAAIPAMLAGNIAAFNKKRRTADYNLQYNRYIVARNAGIAAAGGLAGWIAGGGAAREIRALLDAFGMNARNSALAALDAIQRALTAINPGTINWVSGILLPVSVPLPALVNPATGSTLSDELQLIYKLLAARGSVTISGGYVAASKAMHCLFPELAPMIDGQHTGLSYYHVDRTTYTPPLGLGDWAAWLGAPINGVPSPSPQGAGRASWGCQQFIAAIGANQHIYELWQAANGNPGLHAFLALDPIPGTTGISRIIDKGLW